MIQEKIDYIHQILVRCGYAYEDWYWCYSSARDHEGMDDEYYYIRVPKLQLGKKKVSFVYGQQT